MDINFSIIDIVTVAGYYGIIAFVLSVSYPTIPGTATDADRTKAIFITGAL
jgi:hypothetical protein